MKHESGLMPELVEMAGDLVPDAAIRNELLYHLRWLLETNESMNLTAIKDEHVALRLHVVDSLQALGEVVAAPEGAILDIGTGGGFPGVPLALASGRDAVLLDSVGKKAKALQHYLELSRHSVTALAERAEEHAVHHAGAYAVVVARAVGPLPSLVELAAPLLSPQGRLVALKGRLEEDELRRGDEAAAAVGLSAGTMRRYFLPHGGEERSIAVYTRTGRSRIPLPRRVGFAQKKPLA